MQTGIVVSLTTECTGAFHRLPYSTFVGQVWESYGIVFDRKNLLKETALNRNLSRLDIENMPTLTGRDLIMARFRAEAYSIPSSLNRPRLAR